MSDNRRLDEIQALMKKHGLLTFDFDRVEPEDVDLSIGNKDREEILFFRSTHPKALDAFEAAIYTLTGEELPLHERARRDVLAIKNYGDEQYAEGVEDGRRKALLSLEEDLLSNPQRSLPDAIDLLQKELGDV